MNTIATYQEGQWLIEVYWCQRGPYDGDYQWTASLDGDRLLSSKDEPGSESENEAHQSARCAIRMYEDWF